MNPMVNQKNNRSPNITRTSAASMMSRRLKASLLVLLISFSPSMVFGSDTKNLLRYDRPATKWDSEALPLGNGRLGCMVFGGVDSERIQFNENSLWTGDENPSGNYNTMGEYQNFGDLYIDLSDSHTTVSCSSGHQPYFPEEGIESAVDGNKATKWCVEPKGKTVVLQIQLAKSIALSSYSFTSCPDFPERDPKTWEVAGSTDGKKWTALDKQENQPPQAERGAEKKFSFSNDKEYRYYRISFKKNHGAQHFQIAEIQFPGVDIEKNSNLENYERSLSLTDATHRVTFKKDGVTHTRTMFVSHPGQVMVMRWTSDKPGSITGSLVLEGAHKETTEIEKDTLRFSGTLKNGLAYEAQVRILAKGGQVTSGDRSLRVEGCDEVVAILAAGTNYAMNYEKKWRGPMPSERIVRQLNEAVSLGFEGLQKRHVADYQKLFNRVEVFWGNSDPTSRAQTTDKRLAACTKGAFDPELEQTLFQYGRYLLISSSRRPGLPATLQGLWNDSNNPPWHCDYHSNINIQMCYWPAEPANLSECALPLFDLTMAMLEPSRQATQASFGKVRGWTARTSHNIYGGHGWEWNIPASAWYALHFWEHYAFTGDDAYLRDVAYPMTKEVCEFWVDHLKKLPDGTLVAPNGWSPEHGPREDGVAHDQQIIWKLFSFYLHMADKLGKDRDFRNQIAEMRDKLAGPKIGRWGQLQEWMTDRDDPKDGHRHTSHLFAVYPGSWISRSQTPEWAKAAAVSLEARGTSGDSRREWVWAWRCNLWARLGNGDRAHEMIENLLKFNTLPNLFGVHPPMQLDGNFGITAGMCEMLLQSHANEIELLPALPKAWAEEGRFRGLRARGGFEVDVEWSKGSPTHASLRSTLGGKVALRASANIKEIRDENRKPIVFQTEKNLVRFTTSAGSRYDIVFQ